MQDIPTIMEDMCSQMHNVGNNRIVTDAHGNVEEVNHYYPYGALMGDSRNTGLQPYKYIGKELDPLTAWTGTPTVPATTPHDPLSAHPINQGD